MTPPTERQGPRLFHGMGELQSAVGQELGLSSWHGLTQEQVDAFAHSTGDLNPIHVDPVAAAESPAGTTIAHGLLTLSLGPKFNYEIFEVTGLGAALNYGYERVRFPGPVPIPSKIRMRLKLDDAEAKGDGAQIRLLQTFEREGAERPVCVAAMLIRYVA